MAISINIEPDSNIALFLIVGAGEEQVLKPFAFPSQQVDVPPGDEIYLTRVPLTKTEEALIPLKEARTVVPIKEAVGIGLDGYGVESLLQGGKVNKVTIKVGSPVEDRGITFTATNRVPMGEARGKMLR